MSSTSSVDDIGTGTAELVTYARGCRREVLVGFEPKILQLVGERVTSRGPGGGCSTKKSWEKNLS